jgi:hypothetical protein
MAHYCGECDNTWTGSNMCHCSVCHRTFSTIGLFDRHRPNSKCLDPARLRVVKGEREGSPVMRLNDHGTWVGAEQNPLFLPSQDFSNGLSAAQAGIGATRE